MLNIDIQNRYLHLPIKNGAPLRKARLLVAGQVAREFDLELADESPDWWASLDLAEWMGSAATLELTPLAGEGDPPGLRLIEQSGSIRDNELFFQERLRPRFHFTAPRGWNNDPNGLVYYAGEYHLFYQHNPYGTHWGNMHWGHAASPDLVRWQHLPEALYPDELGTIFSGSGVVDWNNTTGFQSGDEKALVFPYTAAGGTSDLSQGRPFTQCLAFSIDRGRSLRKWTGNPVLPQVAPGNRDPKVIWHAPSQTWIMALYLEGNGFALFASPDLKQWERVCDLAIPGCSECPDLFELALDGNPEDTRWVFWGANTSYLVGRFDGKQFTQESLVLNSHAGGNSYAAQTWSDLPQDRRVQVSWLQVELPGMPFNQGMTFPVELSLHTTPEGIRLYSQPVREIASLYTHQLEWTGRDLIPGENLIFGGKGELFDLQAQLNVGSAAEMGFMVRGVPVTLDIQGQKLACLGRSVPLHPQEDRVRLRMLVDRTSLEIFGNGGQVYLPLGVVFDLDNQSLECFARGGNARLEELKVVQLKSIF